MAPRRNKKKSAVKKPHLSTRSAKNGLLAALTHAGADNAAPMTDARIYVGDKVLEFPAGPMRLNQDANMWVFSGEPVEKKASEVVGNRKTSEVNAQIQALLSQTAAAAPKNDVEGIIAKQLDAMNVGGEPTAL
ncbi:hypothetical protein KIPB_000638 [Kipferlia bialata]|uniref:Nascent polypeptide-associated complex subunit beta n=1 Tax=Kipferlia bialata TaxID=797122 RepID=A0A391NU45_9EUKA|nr:hypothetical protein KIPB_000638 [Kipferlia bialata]|eukprot:g638.t1